MTDQNISIRPAEAADVPALARLIAEPDFGHPADIDFVRERFAEQTEAGDVILVAVCESEVIGMAHLHRTYFLHRHPDGRISSLAVTERYRSFGVGALLAAQAEDLFRKWGCGRIEVTSGAKRERAHRFYLREAFVERPKRFVKDL